MWHLQATSAFAVLVHSVAVGLRPLLLSASQVIRVLLVWSLLPVVLTAATLVLFAIFKPAISKGFLGTSRPLLSTTIRTALATSLAWVTPSEWGCVV